MIKNNGNDGGNTTGRAKFANWLGNIMGPKSGEPSKEVGGLDITPVKNMSNAVTGAVKTGFDTLTHSVDWNFIRDLEGRKLKGYVPMDKAGNVFGQSGVTVGTGFDIGQRSLGELKAMGLPQELVAKLTPYVGKKKASAVQALKIAPLRLSNEEVDLIDSVVKKDALNRLEASYNKNSKVKFQDLLPEQQTILASLALS